MSRWILVLLLGGSAPAWLAGESLRPLFAPRFEEKAGETPGDVRFVVRAPSYAAAFDPAGATFRAIEEVSDSRGVRMQLGGGTRPAIAGEGPLAGATRIYEGTDALPSLWRGYETIRYGGAYPGIDWRWRFREGALEFTFEVSPGTDPSAIRLVFTGVDQLKLDGDGNLEIEGSPDLQYQRPEAWQETADGRVAVTAAFRIEGNAVTFDVGAYERDLPLIIDPVVRYSRQLGGAGFDAAYAVTTDSAGGVYVAGETASADFTSSMAIRRNRDAFVSKLSADGTQMVYTTILSSGGNDAARSLVVDGAGNVWVTGMAGGPGFPVTAGPSGTSSAEDAFVAKLNTAGALVYATRLGGSGSDSANAIGLDGAGNIYIAGQTSSTDFPTTSGSAQTAYRGGTDAFAAKLPAGGGAPSYSTLLGGSGNDLAKAVTVDAAGNACFAGRTDSSNLPVTSPIQAVYGGSGDAFLACLNAGGTAWTALTYLGGTTPDQANAIARDAAGDIYVAGEVFSLQGSSSGTYDAFVMKLTAGGAGLIYVTVLAGSGSDSAAAIAANSTGVWVAGQTSSTDFPVTGAPVFGGSYDGFLASLSVDGKSLGLAGFIGGAAEDRCTALALAPTGEAIVAGVTSSNNFPTTTGTTPGAYNAFVASWKMDKAAITSPTPGSHLTGATVTFVWSAAVGATAYWLDVNSTCVTCGGVLFGRNVGLATSQTVTGLPTNGGMIYVRLWTQLSGAWQYTDSTYTAAGSGARAAMAGPPPGTTLTGSTVTFTWTPGVGASAYWLDVGTSPGVGSYFGRNLGLATSQTVTGLPTNGSVIHIRLWTLLAAGWQYYDYSYVAANTIQQAVVTSPQPGTTLTGSTVTFTWTPAAGASAYWLDVGTSPGVGSYFGRNLGLATSQTVTGLPTNGSAIHVRLWTLLSAQWVYYDYAYVAVGTGAKAVITSPTPGTTLGASTVTFAWSPGSGASAFWLDVGAYPGVGNYFGRNLGLATSQTVTGLPTNGSAIHVRLWTQMGGVWSYNDYSYTASH
jgi:hypothetical protein